MNIRFIDLTIFMAYLVFMLGIGLYFLKKNKSKGDYYLGSAEKVCRMPDSRRQDADVL